MIFIWSARHRYADLPGTNEVTEFSCGDKVVCVAYVNGEINAMDNVC